MKQAKEIKYYTIDQMAYMLSISSKSIRNKLNNLKIKKSKTLGPKGHGLYTNEDLDALRGDKRCTLKTREKTLEQWSYEFHQRSLIVTYYIYESKMNK